MLKDAGEFANSLEEVSHTVQHTLEEASSSRLPNPASMLAGVNMALGNMTAGGGGGDGGDGGGEGGGDALSEQNRNLKASHIT